MRRFFIGLAVLLIRAYLRGQSSKLVVIGKENLPARPGYIVAANHLSYVDPLILWSALRPTIRFWMKTDIFLPLFDPVLVFMCRVLFGVIPVDRKKPNVRTLVRQSRAELRENWVGVFPEGTRNSATHLQGGFAGVATLTRRTGATLIPVAIQGTSGLANPLSRSRTVTVSIGRPFALPERGSREDDMRTILGAIAELLPERQRGPYA